MIDCHRESPFCELTLQGSAHGVAHVERNNRIKTVARKGT